MAFSPGGLTFHGGLLLVIIAVWIYSKRKKMPFLTLADLAAPSLALAYGIGRIGCHLAGDGDYGIPTNLPWGTNYENGTVPPSLMFRGSEIAQWLIPVALFPITLLCIRLRFMNFSLWLSYSSFFGNSEKKNGSDGKLFTVYLMLAGLERLMVEFIRLNPRILFGLSEAQLISVILIIAGLIGYYYFTMNKELKRYNPPPFIKIETKKSK